MSVKAPSSAVSLMPRRTFIKSTAVLAAALAFAGPLGVRRAFALTPPEEKVEEARLTLLRLKDHPDVTEIQRYLTDAKGVFIVPSLIKGGFVIGGEGGTGALLVKGEDGSWSSPAFYTIAAASVGLQIGAQVSEVVFTLMNWGAVNAIIDNNAKLGGDLSVALGPVGKGAEASTTTNLNADVYAFSTAVGAFAGASLEGAALIDKQSWNDQYYDTYAPARAILIDRKFYNGQADALRAALP